MHYSKLFVFGLFVCLFFVVVNNEFTLALLVVVSCLFADERSCFCLPPAVSSSVVHST